MDDAQRKKIQIQLMVFCALGFPGALISFIVYNSIPVLVFTGIVAFMVAQMTPDVLDYYKGEGRSQSHPKARSRSSHNYATGHFYQQDDTCDQSRSSEHFRDAYEQEKFREVHSAQSHQVAQLQRPVQPRRTVQLQYPASPERSGQPQHSVRPRRTAQLQSPVPPRRSTHTRSTWP